ncbi:metallopeptidase TldD-related protein [Inquilinus sp. CAU 1745]|uniref:TldD/PmbA family protein n=1 Tax=Inquilinus sp. CAU 1745 TaxID=3140369 RepID=UPI00325BFEFA
MTDSSDLDILSDLIARARAAGADTADAILADGTSLSLSQRLGRPERLERAEGGDLGLRVFVGRQSAIVSSSDRSKAALAELVERAVAMARAVPEDSFAGLADPGQLARSWEDLDLDDPAEPSAEDLIAAAKEAEETALAISGVTNSEGAEAAWGRTRISLVAGNGFAGSYSRSSRSLSVSVIAGEGIGMETDYDFTSAVYAEDMEDAATIGRRAGERAVARLGARKVASARVPIVYDPRVAGSLLGHLTGAISGPAIARGVSFLKDRMGEALFAPGIEIVDDPHRRRGRRSKPFDGEGIANRRREIVSDGRLTTWLLDLRSARQLGLETTGHAARGTSSPPSPSPTNLFLQPGKDDPKALIGGIAKGLYVTQMMGSAVNGLTGDYSRGATGFWIENGEIAYPVNEVTVAGNLKEMFARLVPASDLTFRTGIDSPTVMIEGMMVAGR